VRVRAPYLDTLAVVGDVPVELTGASTLAGIEAKNVRLDSGGNLYIGRDIKASDTALDGDGVTLNAYDVIRIGHIDRYDKTVHVTSEANMSLHAQSIYVCHTALSSLCHYTGSFSTPSGTAPIPSTADGATVRLYAKASLNATAVSDETIEFNATNTGGVGASTASGGNMSLNSPTINFVGGSGPNQFALATSPNLTFTNGSGGAPTLTYTPGGGTNSFAQSGATTPVLVPIGGGGGGGTTTPPATTPPPPATTTPPPPATTTPPPPATTTPPPPPPPATTPPPPSGSPVVDRIVQILPTVTVADAQKIVNDTDSVLTTFVTKLLAEETRQAEDNEKKKSKDGDLALLTDQQCKP